MRSQTFRCEPADVTEKRAPWPLVSDSGTSIRVEPEKSVDPKAQTMHIMTAMTRGHVAPLFEAMDDDVTWQWMGTKQWSRSLAGKQAVID